MPEAARRREKLCYITFHSGSRASKDQPLSMTLHWCAAFAKGKGCAWVIEDRISGRLLGTIRFNRIDNHSRWAEVGYETHPSVWGRGLTTEAVKAVTRCGFDDFSLNRIEAWTLPGNVASGRVLEKAGFRDEGTLYQKAWFKNAFHDFRMFGCLASEAPLSTPPYRPSKN
ncbi:GNAT family N-acetyltransferase [Agrobacterium rhizogenes]|nr:GNAT family N-acetyltransferase [Rhizobium rhizogenes]